MATPQITLRVDKKKLEIWKRASQRSGTTVSEQLRRLMDAWCATVNRQDENDY